MDQLFDKLGNAIKSLFGEDEGRSSSSGRTGDPDLDEAFAELNDYLDRGKTDSQARAEAERKRRETEDRLRAARQGFSTRVPGGPPDVLGKDYAALGIAFGAPLAQVKSAYKKLLKSHHPDRNSGSPEELRKATEFSAKLNDAYSRIELWWEKGKLS
jgi:DnaJ-domain-containing protein 1